MVEDEMRKDEEVVETSGEFVENNERTRGPSKRGPHS